MVVCGANGRKANSLLNNTIKQIEKSKIQTSVEVVGIWTDSGGAERKMRRLMNEDRTLEHLITVPCIAHQLQLIYHDWLKAATGMNDFINKAHRLVVFFNNNIRARQLFEEEQTSSGFRILSLVLPAATRWSSTYYSTSRLLERKHSISNVVTNKKDVILNAIPETDRKKQV